MCSFNASGLCAFFSAPWTVTPERRCTTNEWIRLELFYLVFNYFPTFLTSSFTLVGAPPPTLLCTLPHPSHLCFITTLPGVHCSLCSVHSSLQLSPSIPAILPMLLLLCMTQFSSSTVFSFCVCGLPPETLCLPRLAPNPAKHPCWSKRKSL